MESKLENSIIVSALKKIIRRQFLFVVCPVVIILLLLSFLSGKVFFTLFALPLLLFILLLLFFYFLYLYNYFNGTSNFELNDEGIKINNKTYQWNDLKNWRILGPRWLQGSQSFAINPTRGFDIIDPFYWIRKGDGVRGIRIYFGGFHVKYINLTVAEDKFEDLIQIMQNRPIEGEIKKEEMSLWSQIAGSFIRTKIRNFIFSIVLFATIFLIIILVLFLIK